MKKILVVEDDRIVGQSIADALRLRDWDTEIACTFAEAMEKIRKESYLLYILDLKLPDGSGITLCREIRRRTETPVLFLSAYDSESYIVEGFEAGGNDYVCKPFRTFELLARIKSLLRQSDQLSMKQIRSGIRSGDYYLDFESQCFFRNNVPVDLTLTEYRIIRCLLTSAPAPVMRARLLDIVWDSHENYVDDNTLSVYINRIRKKIRDDSAGSPIGTRHGIGYIWNLETRAVYETISK